MKATTPKQVLNAALWIIENIGWTREAFYRDRQGIPLPVPWNIRSSQDIQSCCLAGALYLVETDYTTRYKAIQRIEKEIDSHIQCWNDNEGRTKQQVVNVLKKVMGK